MFLIMQYERDEKTEELLKGIIANTEDFIDIRVMEPRICVLNCDQAKKAEGRLVFADIKPVSEQYKALVDFDYIITVYEKNAALLSPDQFNILLEHELRHIDIKNTTKGVVFGTVGHDFEDFYAIINKYGMEWSTVNA